MTSPAPACLILAKSCKSYINSYINSYIDILEKASVRHIVMFLKYRIPICNSEIPDTTGTKTKRRRSNSELQSVLCFAQM